MAYGLSLESYFVIQDSKGLRSNMKMNHPLNTDLGALKAALPTTAVLLDPLIGGQIVDCFISIPISTAGWTNQVPQADGDVEEGCRFTWDTASGAPTDFRIPTFRESFLDSDGLLNTADTDVDAFVQRIISGRTLGLTNVSPADAYGSDIIALLAGQEDFLSSRG